MNNVLRHWDDFLTALVRTPLLCRTYAAALRRSLQTPSVLAQSLFLKRLSMLLRSGLPIGTSLRLLSESDHGLTGSTLTRVVTLVESGVPLSRALADSHYILGTFARNLIRIGEASGTLPENLEYVAVELKTKHELRKQLIQAMIYPAIIIMATVVISVFLIVVIFPKIIPIFQSVHSTLPWSTRALMATSYVLIHYGWWLLFTVVIGLGVLRFSQRSTVIRQVTERGFLRVPVVGKLISSYQIALGCRTFGILLASEVRITEAVSIVSQSTEHTLYREAWIQIGTRVATGQRLSSEILRYPVLFPMIVVQMIQAGETTGTLSDALGFLAAIYESDVRDITKNLTTLLEPLLMLVMGLMVGFIAVSIITPIYGITQYLHA